jgi:hypothetical protein
VLRPLPMHVAYLVPENQIKRKDEYINTKQVHDQPRLFMISCVVSCASGVFCSCLEFLDTTITFRTSNVAGW